MADQNLSELLTEFQNLAESEHHAYIDTIVSRHDNASTIFAALSFFEDRPKPHDLLQPLCDLLFTIYRIGNNGENEYRKFTLQFLPNLIYLYLQNYSDKQGYSSVETLLVSIHNIEMSSLDNTRKSFKVPSIGSSSIYHDASLISESRIFAMPDTNLERGSSSGQPLASTGPISHINAQNRAKVVSHLFSVFAFLLGSVSKDCLDWTCRVSSRMITRGFDSDPAKQSGNIKTHYRVPSYGSESGMGRMGGSKPQISRIPLPHSVYLDLLNLAYFAIHNNIGREGIKLSRDIEYRGKYECVPSVVLVSKAVSQLAATSGGTMVVETPQIATPSVLTKNMITNASFRTKKMEGDIPRVDNGEEENNFGEKMGMILEEAEAEVERMNKLNMKEGQDNPDGIDKVNMADKLKAKIENVRDNVRIPIRKKDKDKDKDLDKDKERGVSESSDKDDFTVKVKPDKKEKKHKSKKGDKNQDHDISSEDYLRMSTLPGSGHQTDTVTIHSPESGNTSIF